MHHRCTTICNRLTSFRDYHGLMTPRRRHRLRPALDSVQRECGCDALPGTADAAIRASSTELFFGISGASVKLAASARPGSSIGAFSRKAGDAAFHPRTAPRAGILWSTSSPFPGPYKNAAMRRLLSRRGDRARRPGRPLASSSTIAAGPPSGKPGAPTYLPSAGAACPRRSAC